MSEQEFNLEDWWENELPDVGDGKFEAFRTVSLSKTTAWGDVGTIGINASIPEDKNGRHPRRHISKTQTIKNCRRMALCYSTL